MNASSGGFDAAVELLRKAAASFRRADPSRLLSWSLGGLAQAQAMRGDADATGTAVSEMAAGCALATRAFGLDWDVGRGWANGEADLEALLDRAATFGLAGLVVDRREGGPMPPEELTSRRSPATGERHRQCRWAQRAGTEAGHGAPLRSLRLAETG